VSKAVLFGTPTCPWCPRAKRYLVGKGVSVKEVNVARDQKSAMEVVRKTGQMGVPVIKIGSKWIVGFDRAGIDRALADRA
jgi:glutaredoxin-like YruB-family protein